MPSYYRHIGQALTHEVVMSLREGRHLALIGPRNGGKSLLLAEVEASISTMGPLERPEIIRIAHGGLRKTGHGEFLRFVASQAAVSLAVEADKEDSTRLAGSIVDLLRRSLEGREHQVWVFVEDILGLPTAVARELLTAFQTCHESPEFRKRIAVVVTGSSDFLDLTASPSSPYRHAEKMLIVGMDRECAAAFFSRRRRQQRGEPTSRGDPSDISSEIDTDAFEYLFSETGGMPHLLQQVVLSHEQSFDKRSEAGQARVWTAAQTRENIRQCTETVMADDSTCRSVLREAERSHSVFETLCDILKRGDGKVRLTIQEPHPLETMGLARRSEAGWASISCPMWRRFLKSELTARYIADVYATHRRWDLAWAVYRELPPEQLDRPVSGRARDRLRRVVAHWEDSLLECAQTGMGAVFDQFFLGARYLLGFEDAVLYRRGTNPTEQLHTGIGSEDAVQHLANRRGSALSRSDGDGTEYWLDNVRLSLWSNYGLELRSAPGVRPGLFLARRGYGREIDTADQRLLYHALRRFWDALKIADDREYRESLRERHLKVISHVNELLLGGSFSLADVVDETATSLVRDAQYSRVLICLADARRERIQAVASACGPGIPEFNFVTDFVTLSSGASPEQLAASDIQQWVVYHNKGCRVVDASSEVQQNPQTQWRYARDINMRGITVVPMSVKDDVFGTIHVERADGQLPSQADFDLLEFFANQIGVMFYEAQRLNLLNESLCLLRDQVHLIDPCNKVIFLNRAAAAAQNSSFVAGWQTSPAIVEHVSQVEDAVHHLRMSVDENGSTHVYHEFTAPIDDFRSQLRAPFKANGRIGYVRQIHDLSDLHELSDSILEWLSVRGTRDTAERVLRTFRDRHYTWCRIYMLRRDRAGEQCLESLEEFGLLDEDRRRKFRNGGTQYARAGINPQPWHVIEVAKEAAIYEENPDIPPNTVVPAPPLFGFPRFFTSEVLDRVALEKSDKQWIEAPLFVGTGPIGKISLSMPKDYLSPGRWELMKTAILGVAVALDAAVGTEHLAQQVRIRTTLEDVMEHLVSHEQNQTDALKSIKEGICAMFGDNVLPTISLWDEEGNEFAELDDGVTPAGLRHGYAELFRSVERLVIERREPIYIDEVSGGVLTAAGLSGLPSDSGVRSFAAVPVTRHNRILGVISIVSKEPIRFDAETQRTIGILARHAGAAIEIVKLRQAAVYSSLIRAADLGYLASGIAHEFLNSLQNIRLLHNRLRRLAADAESHRNLDLLLAEYDKAVGSIATFRRLGGQECPTEAVDVRVIINNLIALSERRALDHNITLKCLVEELPKVRIDSGMFQSIVVNLLRNAMDSVEGKPGERYVEVKVVGRGVDEIEVVVSDNGRGIPPEVSQKMFLPFYTSKGTSHMGVGLFWVHRIVERLNGRISVEARNDMGGATVSVVLPISREERL